jgi:hypothetical protein
MEDFFYHTDKQTRLVRLYVRDKAKEQAVIKKFNEQSKLKKTTMVPERADRTFYSTTLFFPPTWETWSQRQMTKYRRWYSLRFFVWSQRNKEIVQKAQPLDWKHLGVLRNNLSFSCSLIGGGALVINAFMRRLDPPFFYESYFGTSFRPKHLRLLIIAVGVGYLLREQFESLAASDDLFDTGLKYKAYLDKETLSDPLADAALPALQKKDDQKY